MGGNGAFLKSHPSSPPLSSSSPQATFRLLVKIRLVGPREEGCNFGIGEEWRGAFFSWHSVCTLVHFSKRRIFLLLQKEIPTIRRLLSLRKIEDVIVARNVQAKNDGAFLLRVPLFRLANGDCYISAKYLDER